MTQAGFFEDDEEPPKKPDGELPPLVPPDDDIVLNARRTDPETSHESMAAYDPERMRSAMDYVIAMYRQQGPMADYEAQPMFDRTFQLLHDESLYRQARNQAIRKGFIYDTDERRVNPTTNRRQVVWAFRQGEAPSILRCHACGHVLGRKC